MNLQEILNSFNVTGEVVGSVSGPVITRFDFRPARGVRLNQITNLEEDIARSASVSSVRISVVPNTDLVGFEVPNSVRKSVHFEDIISMGDLPEFKAALPIVLGVDTTGMPVVEDLSKMPHILVAGTTGSGKSVGLNCMISSLLRTRTANEVQFVMIDPKMLELTQYNGIAHLRGPVVTDPKEAVDALASVVDEMTMRYALMSKSGARNIVGYNAKHEIKLPYLVVVIDEMADLMMVAGDEVEHYVLRIAQLARAAGIHLIAATQRPSVDVITGTIKANFPTRISFRVASRVDSGTIIGTSGAENLLGNGDMLVMKGGGELKRVHGAYISDEEIAELVEITTTVDEEVFEDAANGACDLTEQARQLFILDQRFGAEYLSRRMGVSIEAAQVVVERIKDESLMQAIQLLERY